MTTIERVPPPGPPRPAPPVQAPYYYAAPVARPGLAQGLVTAILLAILLLILAIVAAVMFLALSAMGFGGRTVGEAGQRAAETARGAADVLGKAGQDARDRFDPTHPPRGMLQYDLEIEELLKLNVGQPLPGGGERAFIVAAIKSRDASERPELSRYAVIHSELRQPDETKVLGITVRRDTAPRDESLYTGEAFRLGARVYKVNWISAERQQIAVVQLRDPDRASVPIKYAYD